MPGDRVVLVKNGLELGGGRGVLAMGSEAGALASSDDHGGAPARLVGLRRAHCLSVQKLRQRVLDVVSLND